MPAGRAGERQFVAFPNPSREHAHSMSAGFLSVSFLNAASQSKLSFSDLVFFARKMGVTLLVTMNFLLLPPSTSQSSLDRCHWRPGPYPLADTGMLVAP